MSRAQRLCQLAVEAKRRRKMVEIKDGLLVEAEARARRGEMDYVVNVSRMSHGEVEEIKFLLRQEGFRVLENVYPDKVDIRIYWGQYVSKISETG